MESAPLFENLPDGWFDKILSIFGACNDEPVEQLQSRLRNPGRREWIAIRRGNFRSGLRGRELRRENAGDWQALKSATDAEIESLIQEARE